MRTHYANALNAKLDGKTVTLAGWVDNVRILGKIAFVVIRDRTGKAQATIPQSNDAFPLLKELTKESVVMVEGKVKKNPQAPNELEIIPSYFKILNQAAVPLPMDVSGKIESEIETRLDNRFMDLRQPKVGAIFSIRDKVLTAIRQSMETQGFVEVHTPKIVGAAAEGGATLFEIDYFKKKAYLNQSPQLFKQMLMASGIDRVYEIAPAFRAEPSATTRHLSEFTSFDFEMAFIDTQEDVFCVLEKCVVDCHKYLKKNAGDELKALGVEMKVPKAPFPQIAFSEVQKKLKFKDNDLDSEKEKALGELMAKKDWDYYFITNFPEKGKPFYIMGGIDGESFSFDLDCNGVELASGGQREHDYKLLVDKIKAKGLKPKEFDFYLQAFKYGMPPHGGMGLGIERLVQKMLGLTNVRETILFPRDMVRMVP